ncbi:family 43 glycosylhydrolase [Pseudoxanthomonas indica]|uniref:F5/8 type C domain-containing protein n=2 Tax=Pseudoxanthomonas indica TaxID=428993 RepID=A0A1T5LFK1_9GAMM|nr:family 43 glycosylhydrolase [Pseudoxanthomonas indica]SKC74634.1 F5/8 type C domain-containing protein [Pseudoxanthomonas indica]
MALAAALPCALTAFAAEPARLTYANPVDIDYRYNFEQLNLDISYRTGADPVIVRHQDAYYLFQTLADGYWRSTNLVDWRFIEPSRWPFDSMVAPAAISDGDRLLLMRSLFTPGAVLESRDPEHGKFDFLTRMLPELPNAVAPGLDRDLTRWHNGDPQPDAIPPGPWDPAFFKDDDGRWYLYWGSSDTFPLYGIELDMRRGVRYIGKPRALLALDPQQHGWERFGQDHRQEQHPTYIEGAWMNKVGGRYYLQYGAPGTEYNAYATGVYVGDSPLGPFQYAPYNPVGYKPGGFVQGAGHGSTFQDAYGNWWNTGTPWLGYNWTFERRIAMFPAAFSSDGQMSVSTRFGDFPHYVPQGPNADPESLFTGWMLLSYRKPATASSTDGEFVASRITDENPRTFWVAARNEPGQTVTVDLRGVRTVRAVQVNFADYKAGVFGDSDEIYTEFRIEGSADGRQWQPLAQTEAPRRDRPNAYLPLAMPARVRYVRYVHGHVGGAHLAISDLRVFGKADGPAPRAPRGVSAARAADPRQMTVRWRAVPGAVGYNVRWGTAPDRLNSSYQVFADQGTAQEIRALNRGVSYHVAVEAFDERGVSVLSQVLAVP